MSTTYKKAKRRFKKAWGEAHAKDPELADFWWTDEKTGQLFHMTNFDTPKFVNAIKVLSEEFKRNPESIKLFMEYKEAAFEEYRKQMSDAFLYGAAGKPV